MPTGKASKKYTAEFKQQVIETMRAENLSYSETGRRFGVTGHHQIQDWERIYLVEGLEGFQAKRRGPGRAGRPWKPAKKAEEDIVAENHRLRAEVAYLKNLQALVLEDERHQHKKRG